jgi:hypothetical protein
MSVRPGDHPWEMGGTIHSQIWRTTVVRRIVSLAVAGAALLAAFGCGGGGSDTSVSAGTPRKQAIVPAAEGDVSASGLRTVTYQGVEFDVPADWPVYDLAAEPTTCVRFDVHAVYLGHPGADMLCPSGILGRADSVLVEPTDGSTSTAEPEAADASATTTSGLEVQLAADGAASSEIAAEVPSAGVSITLAYQDSDATARQILQSFRTAS